MDKVAPVLMPAIPLRCEGGSYVVLIERGNEWVEVLRDSGACSHIVEALGINNYIAHSASEQP